MSGVLGKWKGALFGERRLTGLSCVFGEMLTGKPILSGESDGHQLELIWDLMGSPTEENMPGWKNLPGAEALCPRPRPGCLSTRFREYVTVLTRSRCSELSSSPGSGLV